MILFGFILIWHSMGIIFQLLKYDVWLRINDDIDEGSVPEMRLCSILLIKSDLEWCITYTIKLINTYIYAYVGLYKEQASLTSREN